MSQVWPGTPGRSAAMSKYLPCGQATHSIALVAPGAEILPASQSMQTMAPALEKRPGRHVSQLSDTEFRAEPAAQFSHSDWSVDPG